MYRRECLDGTQAFSYNVRVGTTPERVDIIFPEADPATGVRRVSTLGNLGENSSTALNPPPGNDYWSVPAVGAGIVGSPFSAEQQFRPGPLLMNPVLQADRLFEFAFTSTPGAGFTAMATINVSLALSTWTVLRTGTEVSPGQFQFAEPGGAKPTNALLSRSIALISSNCFNKS